MAKIVINHAFLLCYVKVADPLSFPPIIAIIITIPNELDNHSHFDSMKHSKGYISRGRK